MTDTPETQVLTDMETPVELSQDEMTNARFSYDLPRNNAVEEEESEEEVIHQNGADASEAPEEDSASEIPGDPRAPHQTQPPTSEQF